ncbi:MAG: gliding motility-associated C-terminal domain-containing protein [Bacteroidales bacterium]|nr:gliding motility-associated C-terminal domain-containing protein [Bacteroidales bacterium]MDY0216796.1 gliding motility-associated C-terminal domain-containing protein [Bacteroidales bacterium]
MKCLSVDDGGNVTLTWTPIVANPDFVRYEVYSSLNVAGPYVFLQAIPNINQSSYVHNGAGADFVRVYYFVKSIGTSTESTSDTLSTILLTLTNSGNGNANLSWNSPGNNFPPATAGYYKIERAFEGNPMSLYDSSNVLTYADTIALCSAQLHYRVYYQNTSCISASASKEDFFRDLMPPAIPRLDSVSVSPADGSVQIGWQASSSMDTDGYLLYRFGGGIWSILDTIWGINNTFYNYNEVDIVNQTFSYRIAALDSCLNASPLGDIQTSLLLQYAVNQCASSVNLQWNLYENMPGGIQEYLIYVSRNGTDFEIESTVTGTQNSFVLESLVDGFEYCIYVKAKSTLGITASSPIICFNFDAHSTPEDLFIRYVDVNDNEQIDVGVYVDNTISFTSLKLWRYNEDGGYDFLSEQAYNGSDFYQFTDGNVQTERMRYFYKISLVDICGFEMPKTDSVGSILLTGIALESLINELLWSEYFGYQGGVQSYEIFRATALDGFFTHADIVSELTFLYQDDVFPLSHTGAKFSYYVAAIQDANSFGHTAQSRSNRVTLHQSPNTFIPNAFTPKMRNPIFKPVNAFVDASDYHFFIYSRDGTEIFKTNNPNMGWDGTYKGNNVQAGIYVYLLRYQNVDGKQFDKKGTVLLIR